MTNLRLLGSFAQTVNISLSNPFAVDKTKHSKIIVGIPQKCIVYINKL